MKRRRNRRPAPKRQKYFDPADIIAEIDRELPRETDPFVIQFLQGAREYLCDWSACHPPDALLFTVPLGHKTQLGRVLVSLATCGIKIADDAPNVSREERPKLRPGTPIVWSTDPDPNAPSPNPSNN